MVEGRVVFRQDDRDEIGLALERAIAAVWA